MGELEQIALRIACGGNFNDYNTFSFKCYFMKRYGDVGGEREASFHRRSESSDLCFLSRRSRHALPLGAWSRRHGTNKRSEPQEKYELPLAKPKFVERPAFQLNPQIPQQTNIPLTPDHYFTPSFCAENIVFLLTIKHAITSAAAAGIIRDTIKTQ